MKNTEILKKIDRAYCQVKDHNKPLAYLCTEPNCTGNRLACQICLHELHHSHAKNNMISLLDLINLDSKKQLIKNWPPSEFIRTVGEHIYMYNENEPQNEADFMDHKLEEEIDKIFENIYTYVKDKLEDIKSLAKCKFLNKTIRSENKLGTLKRLYDEAYDLSMVRESLIRFADENLTLIQTETIMNQFFRKNRSDIIEKIQFIYNSIKHNLKDQINHLEKKSKDVFCSRKAQNIELNEALYNGFIDKIETWLNVDTILDFMTIKESIKPLALPQNCNIDPEPFLAFSSTYAKMDDISPICEIRNSHSDELSNLAITTLINQKNNSFENIIISTSDDKSIKIWNIDKKKVRNIIPKAHKDWILSLALFKLSKEEQEYLETNIMHIIVTGSADGNIKLWTLDDGKFLIEIKEAHKGWIYNMEIMPVGTENLFEAGFTDPPKTSNLIVSTSTDMYIKIWDWITTECLRSIHTGIKSSPLTLIPFKRKIPIYNKQASLTDSFNLDTNSTFERASLMLANTSKIMNSPSHAINSSGTSPFSHMRYNGGGGGAGSGGGSGGNSTTHKTMIQNFGLPFENNQGCDSPNNLLSQTNNARANEPKSTINNFIDANSKPSSHKFLIANAGWDSCLIKVWDWTKNKLLAEMKGKSYQYYCLACIPVEDDHLINKNSENTSLYLIAAAGLGPSGHSIEIWDFWERKCIRIINDVHSDWIKSLRVIPTRRSDSTIKKMNLGWLLVTGSSDGCIKFWDWYAGEKVKEFDKEYPVNRNGSLRPGVIQTEAGPRFVLLSSGGEDANSILVFGEDDIAL